MISEFNLSQADIERLRANIDDLQIQSMMFDMDIDYETLSLVRKNDIVLTSVERSEAILEQCPGLPEDHWLRKHADINSGIYESKPWLDKWLEKRRNSDNDPSDPEQAWA